jgi:hypothetical protein
MPTPSKVVSHAPRDIHVLGGDSLVYRVFAGSMDGSSPKVDISFRQGTSLISDTYIGVSVDYSCRVTSSSHGIQSKLRQGDAVVEHAVSAYGFSPSTGRSSIHVFDKPDTVIEVTDQSSLNDAFATINAGSDSHYLVSLSAGTYLLGVTDLTRDDTYLVTFEPDVGAINSVTLEGQVIGGSHLRWRLLNFVPKSGTTLPAFSATGRTVHMFDTCKFTGGTYGIFATPSCSIRAVGCHTYGCDTAFKGVDLLRSCSAEGLTNVFAEDCSVVDGCIAMFVDGNGDSFIRLSSSFTESVAITNNTLVSQYDVKFIASDADLSSSLVIGNVASTSTASLVSFENLRDSVFEQNTFNTSHASGDSLILNRGASSNAFRNNWLFPLTRKAIKGTQFNSVWRHNATGSDTRQFLDTLVSLPPQFANTYMFPKKMSVLLESGDSTSHIFSQGAKVRGQIGALPYTADVDLTYVHRSVIDRPFFNFSGPDPVLY